MSVECIDGGILRPIIPMGNTSGGNDLPGGLVMGVPGLFTGMFPTVYFMAVSSEYQATYLAQLKGDSLFNCHPGLVSFAQSRDRTYPTVPLLRCSLPTASFVKSMLG